MSRQGQIGTIYLLHFDRPYRHARHYTGWTTDLDARLAQHIVGNGARLMGVIEAAGINWTLARTWQGTRADERALKRQGGASRRCPCCGVSPRPRSVGPARPGPGRDRPQPPAMAGEATRRTVGQTTPTGPAASAAFPPLRVTRTGGVSETNYAAPVLSGARSRGR